MLGASTMLKSNLKNLLDARRMTIREFSKAAGFRFESCRQMYHNQMTRYPAELIEGACRALKVTPNDLFIFTYDEEDDRMTREDRKEVAEKVENAFNVRLTDTQKDVIRRVLSGDVLIEAYEGGAFLLNGEGEQVKDVSTRTLAALKGKGVIVPGVRDSDGSIRYEVKREESK